MLKKLSLYLLGGATPPRCHRTARREQEIRPENSLRHEMCGKRLSCVSGKTRGVRVDYFPSFRTSLNPEDGASLSTLLNPSVLNHLSSSTPFTKVLLLAAEG
ncbi:hypothetical protein EYF80_004957 [Liparis tanakae]|uniref:Uncharacterized protein n=1 Tax=Liparis tanakae TaxID=230148 RepID=A0A4Z2J5Y9_9TELE|nr:hypothetical protein EYF80_004957 [Liparis tanakae]